MDFFGGGTFQNEVRVRLTVRKSNLSLFHIILRYVNPGTEEVSGRITVYPSWAKSGRYNFKPLYCTFVVVLLFRDRASRHSAGLDRHEPLNMASPLFS